MKNTLRNIIGVCTEIHMLCQLRKDGLFFHDVMTMPFDKMAVKDLETIKQTRKQKKLEQKQVTL